MYTCTNIVGGQMYVRAANVGDEDIFIKPRTRIGTTSEVEDEGLSENPSASSLRGKLKKKQNVVHLREDDVDIFAGTAMHSDDF